jgi:hypothetical protein
MSQCASTHLAGLVGASLCRVGGSALGVARGLGGAALEVLGGLAGPLRGLVDGLGAAVEQAAQEALGLLTSL